MAVHSDFARSRDRVRYRGPRSRESLQHARRDRICVPGSGGTRKGGGARGGVNKMADRIVTKGAREHNLKNIDLESPRDRLVVITGLSGSGKSSLAFDTIYAEGQRRYVESLSAYARQFLEQMEKPDVDSIEGLSPAISIEQKTTSRNPRSTVATITEIYDYLRLLFARVGHAFCHNCGREITQQSVQQIVDRIMAWPEGTRIHVLAPIVRDRKGEYRQELSDLRRAGLLGHRLDHVFRSRAGGAKRRPQHRRRRDRALGHDELHAAGARGAGGALQVQPRHAVEEHPAQSAPRDSRRLGRRGDRVHLPARRASPRLRTRVRRRADLARPPLQGDRLPEHPRDAGVVHEHAAVSRVQRRAAEEGKPPRSLPRQIDRR